MGNPTTSSIGIMPNLIFSSNHRSHHEQVHPESLQESNIISNFPSIGRPGTSENGKMNKYILGIDFFAVLYGYSTN